VLPASGLLLLVMTPAVASLLVHVSEGEGGREGEREPVGESELAGLVVMVLSVSVLPRG